MKDKEQSFEWLDFDSSKHVKLQNTTPEQVGQGMGEITWSRQFIQKSKESLNKIILATGLNLQITSPGSMVSLAIACLPFASLNFTSSLFDHP